MRLMMAATALFLLSACPSDDAEPPAGACRFLDEGIRAAGPAPLGAFSIAWACQGGCGDDEMLPPPLLTESTSVEIADGALTWRGPSSVVEVSAATADGACWVIAASDTECRSGFRVCMERGAVRANPIAWYDADADWGQRWRVDQVTP